MSFLKKLFGNGGGGAETKAPTEDYKGYRIIATPIAEGQSFRIAATIEKEVAGEVKQHKLIRADTIQGLEAAQVASMDKAKQVIDQQGDRIFN